MTMDMDCNCKNVSIGLNNALNLVDSEQCFSSVIDNLSNREHFCFVKLIHANSSWPCSFTRAWCACKRNRDEEDANIRKKVVYYNDIFDLTLLQKIKNYRDGDEISVSKMQSFAISKLSHFLATMKETTNILLKQKNKYNKEMNWAAVFGKHVLSKLAISTGMLISDVHYSAISQCPCGCESTITVGDTSMGNQDVWHGSADIIVGDVAVLHVEDRDLMKTGESSQSSCEVNVGCLETARNQMIAQTIVFSFVQKKGLVPTIAISREDVKFFMYDTEYDLLLESTQLEMFCIEKGETVLNLRTIFAIWFLLNYCHFCTGTKPAHALFGYTADFYKSLVTNSVRQKYTNECHLGHCKHGKNTNYEYRSTFVKLDRLT